MEDPGERDRGKSGRATVQATAAVGAGVGNNVLVKLLGGMPAAEIAALRAAGVALLLLPLVVRSRSLPVTPALVLRSAAEAFATLFLILSLKSVSLSLVATIMMAIPIGVMLAGWFVPHERLSARGCLFCCVAFVGAAIATGPAFEGAPFGVAAALLSALCFVVRDLIARRRLRAARTVDMSFAASVATLALTLPVAVYGGILLPAADETVLIAGMMGLYLTSNLLIAYATREGRPAIVAACRYTAVLWAAAIDILLFGTVPGSATLAGAGLIMASGIGLAMSERARRRRPV